MNIRNEQYNQHGTIDCEIEHDKFGWIPCTLSPDDSETSGLFEEVKDLATPYEPPPPPSDEELKAELISQFEKAIQSHLDKVARSYKYDSILSACSYAGYANRFQAEGQQFIAWRGAVWDFAYSEMDKYTIETAPTIEEFINQLPLFEDFK